MARLFCTHPGRSHSAVGLASVFLPEFLRIGNILNTVQKHVVRCENLTYIGDVSSSPIHDAYPKSATNRASVSAESDLRPTAAAIARSQKFADAFVTQIQQSMLQSLAQLGAENDDSENGDDSANTDIGLGQAQDQTQLLATIYSGMKKSGASEAKIQAQLSALAAAGFGAGAGSEASRAQQLLSSAGASSATDSKIPEQGLKANVQIVAAEAKKRGIDPAVAVAMMLVESGGRNTAVGDNGTSFGLFQLHEGGMLTAAGLNSTQAFNPKTNAMVALAAYRHEYDKGHERRTAGQIAAASQRPADPVGYASKVDNALSRARALLAGMS